MKAQFVKVQLLQMICEVIIVNSGESLACVRLKTTLLYLYLFLPSDQLLSLKESIASLPLLLLLSDHFHMEPMTLR